ncbi:GNAT family N-acetyltransferase [Hungatella hathewayi]|uniref:GNAT family N-acetyltransferase n=1 Tax=Hungatella hathewayi TaxID=154046 RepID=UPI003567D73F
MEIRLMIPSDNRFALSHIYEESWRYAYKGIIPQAYLDSIPTGRWAANFDQAEMNTIVMIQNDIFIGTTSFCKSRYPEFKEFGEIVSLYMLPEYMGNGYGKHLLNAAVDGLIRLGYCDIFLWVLEENYRARSFYEKAGFKPTNHYLNDSIGGRDLWEVQYRFCTNSCV